MKRPVLEDRKLMEDKYLHFLDSLRGEDKAWYSISTQLNKKFPELTSWEIKTIAKYWTEHKHRDNR